MCAVKIKSDRLNVILLFSLDIYNQIYDFIKYNLCKNILI